MIALALAITVGGAACFGAGRAFQESRAEEPSVGFSRLDRAQELATVTGLAAIVWALGGFVAFIVIAGIVGGIAAAFGANY
jgi:nitrate/nitrite transporter NarK